MIENIFYILLIFLSGIVQTWWNANNQLTDSTALSADVLRLHQWALLKMRTLILEKKIFRLFQQLATVSKRV